jgi:hypothetical protein
MYRRIRIHTFEDQNIVLDHQNKNIILEKVVFHMFIFFLVKFHMFISIQKNSQFLFFLKQNYSYFQLKIIFRYLGPFWINLFLSL